MINQIDYYTSNGVLECPSPEKIQKLIIEENKYGFKSLKQYIDYLKEKTCCMTLLAGSGSRWLRSIAQARDHGRQIEFEADWPRGLYKVDNYLKHLNQDKIPIAAYSFNAVKGMGKHLIVIQNHEKEIIEEILKPLNISASDYQFHVQKLFKGKPLGHGAAAWESSALWQDYKYLIVNFGGDANSHDTIASTLLALDLLNKEEDKVDLLLPAAFMENPRYEIELDKEGFPRSFLHDKLKKSAKKQDKGLTNVGVRIYRTASLYATLEYLHQKYFNREGGYQIPDNSSNELALDNADDFLAAKKRVRVLALADKREITPAKSLDDIPSFLKAIQQIYSE